MQNQENILNKIAIMKKWGKQKFIIFYGLGLYGFLLFFVYQSTMLFINAYNMENFSFFEYISDENNIIRFSGSFILFELMGVYLANSSWKRSMKK